MKALTSSISLLAVCAIAVPATADVTAAEIWAEWQARAAENGMPINATATPTANGLSLSQMTWTGPSIPGEPDMTLTMSGIEMTEITDGVAITLEQPFQIAFEGSENGETLGRVIMELIADGFVTTATGSGADISYGVSSSSMILRLAGLEEIKGPQPEVDFELSIAPFDALYRYIENGDDRDFQSTISTGPADFNMEVLGPPNDPGRITASFQMGSSETVSRGENINAMQGLMMAVEPNSAIAGASVFPSVEYQSNYQSLAYDFDVDVPGTLFQLAGSNAGGFINGGFGPDGISFDIGASDAVVSLRSNEIPVPVDLSAAGTRVAISMPATAEPQPSDFSVVLDYRDLVVSDALWSMFDPGQAIPRDPLTMQLDLSGTAQMFTDLIGMDPATLAGPPGELRSASLNGLTLSAAGAQLTGVGAVEFQPGAFPPMPVGQVDLALEGLTGLMNALTMAGLVPAEQAMMAQAMLGAFARPGAGPDTLESTIEFTPGGGITANGMPIR